MSETVKKALRYWGWEGAKYRLVAKRENAVYEVMTVKGPVALRLHRVGYRTDQELKSELAWMAEIERGGISTPAPLPTMNGHTLVIVDDVQVDTLTWLSGQPLADICDAMDQESRAHLFYKLGKQMATLHHVSDDWNIPKDFLRVHWDKDGLLGDQPLWDRFWDNPALKAKERDLFIEFRNLASEKLAASNAGDYGLIHADLVPANILIDGEELQFIDYDDGGYGYRLFDIATALLKHHTANDFPQLQDKLLEGYLSVRTMDVSNLDLFMAIRAVTYLGWNIKRLNEENGQARNQRFIETSKCFVSRYLSN